MTIPNIFKLPSCKTNRTSPEKQWLESMYFLLKARPFLGDMLVFGGCKVISLPSCKTNIAGWKIHRFDGIYQERWGCSWAMLVSGRVVFFFKGFRFFFLFISTYFLENSYFELKNGGLVQIP